MQFSTMQKKVLSHHTNITTTCVSGGAVRSGKSYATMLSFALWLLGLKERADHAIVGQSIEAIMRSMGFDFVDIVNKIPGARADMDRKFGTRIVVRVNNPFPVIQNIWVVGASDERARRRIQGSTLKGLVIEELTLVPEDFFNMAWSRLTHTDSKMWASFNPEGPGHWAKRNVVDRIGDFKGVVHHFKMRDNPILTEETIERFESSLKGHYYKRYIEGLWSVASGACWPNWDTTTGDPPYPRYALALDWAVSGTLAALIIYYANPCEEAVVAHEFYHSGDDGTLSQNTVAELIVQWVEAVSYTHLTLPTKA